MKCSVVILNWNGEKMLRQYLPSVVAHTHDTDVEIVVADNGSTDQSMAVVTQFPSVRWLPLGKNYGFAEGYNRALAQINSLYSVLLNSDVEVTDGWLSPLLHCLDTHSEVVACQPKVMSWTHRTYFEHAGAAGGRIDRLFYPYCRGRVLNQVEEDHGQYDDEATIFWATGACLCIRTQAYLDAGGLDAEFFAHMEEIDLCWRLQCRGWKLHAVPQSVIYHLGGGSLAYSNPRKTYLNFRNNLLMIYKNLPSNRLLGVMIARFILDYMAAIQMVVTGQWLHAKAIFRARLDYIRIHRGTTMKNKRIENIHRAVIPYPETIDQRFILWDYYSALFFRSKRN